MTSKKGDRTDPRTTVVYSEATVSKLVNIQSRTIVKYERLGLIKREWIVLEERSRQRCYLPEAVERLRKIKSLTADLGVNLAGVEVILHLLEQLEKKNLDRIRKGGQS